MAYGKSKELNELQVPTPIILLQHDCLNRKTRRKQAVMRAKAWRKDAKSNDKWEDV